MKTLIENLKNIFRIPELRQRVLYTLLLLAVFRLGSFVVLPGIDSLRLEQQFMSSQAEGIMGLLNTFVGGAFSRGSIFALGIMPYISASIIVQLLATVSPAIHKMQKEGESGQRKLNQMTRYFAVAITAFQAAGYVVNLQSQFSTAVMAEATPFWITTVFTLTAGTMFLVWLGDRITEKGIGNGVSLIIAIGIIAELPPAMLYEASANPLMVFYIELLALGLVTMGVILLTTGVRRVAVDYARRMVGGRMAAGSLTNTTRQYIPLKLNSAGVMPIIFAQAIMFIPAMIATFFPESDFWNRAGTVFSNITDVWYNLIFITLIIAFTYFYTAIAVNPDDIAEQLKRNGGYIQGVQPGKPTAEYIDTILTRITLPGSIFLGFVAIMPAIVSRFGVSTSFANFFGGTGLLIMISVVLDTLQQIESILLMRKYDGIMAGGGAKPNPMYRTRGLESPVPTTANQG